MESPFLLGRGDRGGSRAPLAARLHTGDVVTVSGRTRHSGRRPSSAARAGPWASKSLVTSPTYTIGIATRVSADVSHLDLYRFLGPLGGPWGDLEPYFDDAIVFVEWPEAGSRGAAAGALGSARARGRPQAIVLDGADAAL